MVYKPGLAEARRRSRLPVVSSDAPQLPWWWWLIPGYHDRDEVVEHIASHVTQGIDICRVLVPGQARGNPLTRRRAFSRLVDEFGLKEAIRLYKGLGADPPAGRNWKPLWPPSQPPVRARERWGGT